MITSLFDASFDRRVGSKFVSQGRYLSAAIRAKLLYAKPVPWSGDWEAPSGDWEAVTGDTDYSAHKLPGKTDPNYAAIYAAVNDGSGFWYDSNGDPVAHLVSEILAEIRTNTWNIWCNSRGRLMVFSKALLYSEAAVVEKYILGSRPATNAPPTTSDVVLHYDAEKSELSELTGGASSFAYNVLSPQYERQSDGSYVNVGARPAVDTFDDGFVGLRSCGQVYNIATVNLSKGTLTTINDGWYDISAGVDGAEGVYALYPGSLSNDALKPFTGFFTAEFLQEDIGKKIKYTIKRHSGSFVDVNGEHTIVAGVNVFVPLTFTQRSDSYGVRLVIVKETDSGYANLIKPLTWQITQSSYSQPYVPPGVTQPASNATTTNGSWFANPLDSDLWKAVSGNLLTMAMRIKVGFSSSDIPNGTSINTISVSSSTSFCYIRKSGTGDSIPSAVYDGTSTVYSPSRVYTRYSVLRVYVQASSTTGKFRTGFLIEGADTSIQWSALTNYDGSFNPSTLYRLLLFAFGAYPIWLNKITLWKRQVPDDELMVAWL